MDVATQLATFSGVEQQVKTNDLLAAFSSQFATSNLGEMAGWVGMHARMAIPGDFDGTPIEIVIDEATPEIFAEIAEVRTINGQAIVALDSGALYPATLVRGLR